MQNLNDIFSHLNQGELPQPDGSWAKANKETDAKQLDEGIQKLTQLVFAAISGPVKKTTDCLQLVSKIESQAEKVVGKKITLNQAKSRLIGLVSDKVLRNLENLPQLATSPKRTQKIQRILAGWNEILLQSQQGNEKVTLLEKKLTTFFDPTYSADTFKDLQKIATSTLCNQVKGYLDAYEKINQAFQSRDQQALSALIKSDAFPYSAPTDLRGNTLLHRLLDAGYHEQADLLLQKHPEATDVPNNNFQLPLTGAYYYPFSCEALQKASDDLKKGLALLKENPAWASKHPIQTSLWLEQAIAAGSMADAALCQSLRNFSSIVKGQSGKNLLSTAILYGHPAVVKQLLDLGVSPQGVYGTPLSNASQSFTTPLHQAVYAGHIDIAALLLERGANIYAPDETGVSVADWIIKRDPNSGSPFPNIAMYRFLEAKIAPDDLASFTQAILEQAVETQNWPEVARLIKQGVVPNKEVQPWAQQALEQEQYDLIWLLVDKNLLTQVTPEALVAIIDHVPLAWSTWFLEQMVKNGLDLNAEIAGAHLLEIALSKHNYPLAAFLMSLGADPAHAGAHRAALVHYALQLKQGSAAAQQLRRLIHSKNIAHLLGDPLIKNMRGDDGRKLEGNLSSESIAFYSACLDFVQDAHPELADAQFRKMSQQMKKAEQLALRIGSISQLKQEQSIQTGISHLEEELLAEIKQLPVGEPVLIPVGWISGDIGHAILIECKRTADDQVEINVINTGGGIEYHGIAHDQAREHVNTLRQHRLAFQELEAKHLLRKLIEPKAAGSKERRYFAEDFYGALDPYCIADAPIPPDAELPKKSKKAQLGGSCSLRCLLAYSKFSQGVQPHKEIKSVISEKVMQFALEQNQLLLEPQPALSKLLSMAAPHLFHNFIKRLATATPNLQAEEQKLARLTSIKTGLQEAIPKPASENKKMPTAESFPTQPVAQAPSMTVHSFAPTAPPKSAEPAVLPLPVIDLAQLSTAKQLTDHLANIIDRMQKQTDPTYVKQYLTSTLLTLGRSFLAPKEGSSLAQLRYKLMNDPANCALIVAQLDLLATKLAQANWEAGGRLSTPGSGHYDQTSTHKSNLAEYAALQYAFVMGRELCIDIEEEKEYPQGAHITDFGCTMLPEDIDMTPFRTRLVLHAEIEEDYKLLREYAKQIQKKGDTPSNLFDFSSQSLPYKGGFSLKGHKSDQYFPEFSYAKKHATTHTDWTEADSSYQKALEDLKTKSTTKSVIPDLDKEEWRTHWFSVYKTPAHFQHLRRLAFLCWMEHPNADPRWTLSDKAPELRLFADQDAKKTRDNKIPAYPGMRYLDNYWHSAIDIQDKGEVNSGLPPNMGDLARDMNSSTSLKVTPSDSQNQTILWTPNILARELMSIRCSVSTLKDASYTPLTAPLLIDFFERQPDELSKLEQRHFFELNLFAMLRFPLAIQKLPDLAKDINAFFNKALNHFEDKIATSVEVSSSTEAAAFLVTQWQRALVYLEKGGVAKIDGQSVAEQLEKVRAKIKLLLQDPKFQNENVRQNLYLALIDSYHGSAATPESLAQDTITSMAGYWKSVQTNQSSSKLFPAFVVSATTLPIEKQAQIKYSLNDPATANKILGAVAALYNISIPEKAIWNCAQFPVCSCQTSSGQVEVNVLTGRFQVDQRELIPLPEYMRKGSSSYQELFGDKILELVDCKDYLQAEDKFGAIRLIRGADWQRNSITQIHREIDNQWYCHIPAKETKLHPALPAFSHLTQLTLWRSPQDPPHYLYMDPKTMKPQIRLEADGRFTLLDERRALVEKSTSKRWEWVDMQTVTQTTDLHTLDPDAFILQAEAPQPPRPMLMQFPHIKDENGATLEFERRYNKEKNEVRWVVRNRPHLFLADKQQLPNLRGFNNFLILENANGARSALIPIKTKEQLNNKGQVVDTECIHVNVKEDALNATEPKASAYLAYLALIHAVTPEDYQQSMAFLKKARKFERYSADELRLLGLIHSSHKVTNDYTGPAEAVRLFANWLVAENFRRNPIQGLSAPREADQITLSSDSPAEHWQLFWEGKLPKDKPEVTAEASTRYFALQAHLPYGMRLQDVLSAQELMDWPLPQLASGSEPLAPPLPVKVKEEEVELLNKLWKSTGRPSIPIPSRPSQEALRTHFFALIKAASSDDPERRKLAEEQWQAMRFDPDNQTFSLILAAALAKDNPAAQAVMTRVNGIMGYVRTGYSTSDEQEAMSKFTEELQTSLSAFAPHMPALLRKAAPPPQVTPVEILPPAKPIQLPSTYPKRKLLTYTSSHTSMDIPSLKKLFSKAFKLDEGSKREKPEPFVFETKDPWLQKCIKELNEDYLAGVEKNQAMPKYTLQAGQTIDNLLNVERKAIADEADRYPVDMLQVKEKEILVLAKRPPADKKEALKQAAEVTSGRKKALDMRTCVSLFLQSDPEAYRRATSLQDEGEIAKLHNLIGDYILHHNKLNQCRETLKAFDRLETVYHSSHTPEQLRNVLQRLAEVTSLSTDYVGRQQTIKQKSGSSSTEIEVNPAVLLVFEYKQILALRDHQVEGIMDMSQAFNPDITRARSVLLQRIQGGGKTLTFGHTTALLKADGYHLSIHVSPTATYKTALYDMRERSDQIYEQREHTIVFDDDPAKFTPEYLTWMKQMLTECIVNRDYVNTTSETLRAMRCKYLKTRFEIQHARPGTDVSQLEQSNQLLKQILHLMRTRGIFTFDEMHITFDPLKELNMPYGQPDKPRREESQLIAEILKYACLAKDQQQKPLLDLAHSSAQTEAQVAAMKAQIVEQLLLKPQWNHPEIKAYLNGTSSDIPEFLKKLEHMRLTPLVILARQMLAGNWLQERLSLNVNEHHGLPQKEILPGAPRISIPFIANMKPAYGSEFSDRYVMTTNALISYLTSGLNAQQTKALIDSCRKRADAEKTALREKEPACTVRDTPISHAFKKATGIDLYSIDLEKPEQVQQVQQALLARNADAMQLLLDFVIDTEIGHVELFENQVCSNGQNEASMGRSFIAYSGSFENLNMAPLGSVKKPEKGTNGQTIDLLIQQKTEVHLVDDENIPSLFAMMKRAQSKNIHAIIDVGAYFRGKSNEEAARMICDHLREVKSEIQGVLFFDDATDRLCFMHRDPPYAVKKLSGTTPEVIEAETGFKKAQLFTYYDQVHMTGVDISQEEQATAVMTMSKHTKIHEPLQGSRRMRELDFMQRILVALPRSAVAHIGATLNQTYGPDQAPTIKQLLLFSHIQEATGQRGENLMYAMQKLENLLQQHILDKLYMLGLNEERELFEKTSYLFEKSVAIDLIKQYAHKRKDANIDVYFKAIKETLLEPLKTVLPSGEYQALNDLIAKDILNPEAFAGMKPTIEVHAGFNPDQKQTPLAVQNRETSRVQSRQQERVSEKLEAKLQEDLNEYLRQIESRKSESGLPATEIKFTKEVFFSEEFDKRMKVNINSKNPRCWILNSALSVNKPESKTKCTFDDNILVTNNAAKVTSSSINLLDPYRKKPWPVLVICDEEPDEPKEWTVILCSIADGINFEKLLSLKKKKGVEGRQMWLLRANGKRLAGPGVPDIDSDPNLSRMMTQALFFTGDFETLSYSPWKARIEKWFASLELADRREWVHYFEDEILMGSPPGYKSSPLYRFFHP